jgi:hypothetical protein
MGDKENAVTVTQYVFLEILASRANFALYAIFTLQFSGNFRILIFIYNSLHICFLLLINFFLNVIRAVLERTRGVVY